MAEDDMNLAIGARILLTTMRGVCYRGSLHSYSTAESTISLYNTISLGTEDRRPAHEYIAPSARHYPFIVFRLSDVANLDVLELGPRREIPDDPAIASTSDSIPPVTITYPRRPQAINQQAPVPVPPSSPPPLHQHAPPGPSAQRDNHDDAAAPSTAQSGHVRPQRRRQGNARRGGAPATADPNVNAAVPGGLPQVQGQGPRSGRRRYRPHQPVE